MHVRRTDYVIVAARSHFSLSDDLSWCGENISYPGIAYCEFEDTLLSFANMQLCDHIIIANSSFSWWAAWLGEAPGKKVISPRSSDWFGRNQPFGSKTDQMIPSRWIQISVNAT